MLEGQFRTGNPADLALKIVLVTENRALGDALVGAFRHDRDVRGIRQFSSLAAAMADIGRDPAHCALIEASVLRGERAAEMLRRPRPDLRVVLYGLDETPRTILTWARIGAAGFVPRSFSAADVVEATKAAVRGEPHCSARVVAALLGALSETGPAPASPIDGLTPREREVVRLAARGQCNKRIARTLGIEPSTAKTHMHNILRKTRLSNRRELEIRFRRYAGAPAAGAI